MKDLEASTWMAPTQWAYIPLSVSLPIVDITNQQQASFLLSQSIALNFPMVVINQAQRKDDQTHPIDRIFFSPKLRIFLYLVYDRDMVT